MEGIKVSKKRLSVYEQNKLLNEYSKACENYYRDSNEQTLASVVKVEHECNANGVRTSDLTKVRFSALNKVEGERQ